MNQKKKEPCLTDTTAASHILRNHPVQRCSLADGEILTYCEINKNASHGLLFLPGYACDACWLAAVHATLPAFRDHYILAVNPRGFGESTNKKSVYSHQENAKDVKLLLDILGIDRKNLMVMGYSTGGAIALWMALLFPETISAASLLNSIPKGVATELL